MTYRPHGEPTRASLRAAAVLAGLLAAALLYLTVRYLSAAVFRIAP